MQLYGANYIALVIIQFIGISHTHFLSYSPKMKMKKLTIKLNFLIFTLEITIERA